MELFFSYSTVQMLQNATIIKQLQIHDGTIATKAGSTIIGNCIVECFRVHSFINETKRTKSYNVAKCTQLRQC